MRTRLVILLLTIVFGITMNLSAQLLPPDSLIGPPLFDKNEEPNLVNLTVDKTEVNHFQSLIFNIQGTDDSEVHKILLLLKADISDDAVEHEVVFEKKAGAENTYSGEIEISNLIPGRLFYSACIFDDENKNCTSPFDSITISTAIPEQVTAVDMTSTYQSVTIDITNILWANSYRIETSRNDRFDDILTSMDIDQNENGTTTVQVENLDANTRYYFRIYGVNDYETSEYYEANFETQQTPPLLIFSNEVIDFGIVPINEYSILESIDISGENFNSDLTITVPENVEILDEYSVWNQSGDTIIIPVNDNGIITNTTLSVRYKHNIIESTTDYILFESNQLTTVQFPVLAATIAATPSTTVSHFDALCPNQGQMYINWEFDDLNILPESLLIIIAGKDISYDIEDGIDPTIANTLNFDNELNFISVDPELQEITLSGVPPGQIYDIYLYAYNGSGSIINFENNSDDEYVRVVTRFSDLPICWINEFHYDNSGTDEQEYIEVYIENYQRYDITDFEIQTYKPNGEEYKHHRFSEGNMPQDNTSQNLFYVINTNLTYNSLTGIALVYQGTVIEFISYDGTVSAIEGYADGLTSVDVGLTESSSTPVGTSIQRIGDGIKASDFSWVSEVTSSWGNINTDQTTSGELKSIWIGDEDSSWNIEENWIGGIPSDNSHIIIKEGHDIQIEDAINCKTITIESDAQVLGAENIPVETPTYVHRKFDVDRWNFFTPPVTNLQACWLSPESGLTYLIEYDNTKPYENSWTYIEDETTILNPMKGYGLLATRDEYDFCFSGFLISQNPSVQLFYSDEGNNWNCVGNPYLSSIKWPVNDTENITGSAYIFDPAKPGYITINRDGTSTDESNSGHIPSLQGFIVKSTQDGFFSLDSYDQEISSEPFYKSAKPSSVLSIEVKNGDNFDNVLLITKPDQENINRFNSEKLLYIEDDVPQIFFHSEDDNFSILNTNSVFGTYSIGIQVNNDQEISLSIPTINTYVNDITATLYDSNSKSTWDLSNGETVVINTSTDDLKDRFKLIIESATGNNELDSKVFAYAKGKLLYVSSTSPLKHIQIFSISGKTIIDVSPSEHEQFSCELNRGLYIIKIDDTYIQKIHIK